LFFNDLCDLLGVDRPQARAGRRLAQRLCQRALHRCARRRKRGQQPLHRHLPSRRFICEAKSFALGKNAETADRKLFKAKSQAESYARNLPESEPRPPI